MSDDKRMHGGNTPGMVPGRGHERYEEPVRLNHAEPDEDQPGVRGSAREDMDASRGHEQDSALGGHTATTSGTAATPADERND